MKLQRQIIKRSLVIQEIKIELTFIKIKERNDNGKNEGTISQQTEDTKDMKIFYNRLNQHIIIKCWTFSNTVETYDLKLKPSHKSSTSVSGWDIHTDTDIYPILKSANEINFYWNKFFTNLSNIKLELEKLNDIQKFETVSTPYSVQH